MLFVFKIVIVFLIVFKFYVPIVGDSAIVSIFLCAIYYIVKKGSIPITYFFQRYNAVIFIGTLSLAAVLFLIAFLHSTVLLSLPLKRVLVELMMLGAIVFALPLLLEGKESRAVEELIIVFCYAFAIQGLIGLVGFVYEPFGDFLFDMKPESIKESMSRYETPIEKFRMYSVSDIFFVELTAAFGVAFIIFFWVQLTSDSILINRWKKFLLFFFIFLGTALSGRTGFIGLLIGFGGWLLFSYNSLLLIIKKNAGGIIGFSLLLFVAYQVFLTEGQRRLFNEELFPFAFEWYYNYRDYGKFEVRSMEATSFHYYYIHDETLLFGHGTRAYRNENHLYPHSDAGYTNTLVFGGITLLLALIIYQCLYFFRPMTIALNNKSKNYRIDFVFFLLLFTYIFIVDIKAPALGYLHLVEVIYLAIGSGYITQYYFKKEEGESIQ